ncbi:MAG TPA: 2-succinyl-5-enolpyruvyl-6-hydroxy-3-cyclohexene-1-carboxylic-acid synthase [Actinomycetes bacterium]|nr:2-succinyl-5-enolpyruvyl-6-hydroxy-3-cyclohexene-1-carboxylic-acid synthase [Actinomycetes bacterium]
MNPSTALATVVVDELVRAGVREAVLSPGSRNAPLSFALHDADRAGRLRLHVRIDERTAGFLALGLAKATGLPVPVVTTSGTAAVNLHPAVVEADYSRVPLVVLTADRPEELRGVGANQTIDQVRLYGSSVRFFYDLSVDTDAGPSRWRTLVDRALGHGVDGPVHLNVAFREPLVPDEPSDGADGADGADPLVLDAEPELARVVTGGRRSWGYLPLAAGGRTVVVAGDQALADARGLAEAGGWPLLAEPSSGHRAGPNAIGAYRLLLDSFADDIERVVVAGRPTLSRPVTRLLARDDVDVFRLRDDPMTPSVTGLPAGDWLTRWTTADAAARKAVADVLAAEPLSGPAVAAEVARAVPSDGMLVAGSSSSVRDLDLTDPWASTPTVLANRGASGIDGTVSTAVGAALGHGGPAYALVGDLTFLHDSTGLVIGPDEPRPDLTVVVVNDDGGGLFTLLEQGAPAHAASFDRVFGTPHGVDLEALCRATATAYVLSSSLDELRTALDEPRGIRVVEVRADRSRTRDLHERLRAAVTAALP